MVPWVSLFPEHFKPLRERRMKAENHGTRCGVKQLGGFRSEKLGGKVEVSGDQVTIYLVTGMNKRIVKKEDSGGRPSNQAGPWNAR